MANKVNITLDQAEYSALLDLAVIEMRSAPEQARWLLRKQFEKLEMLPAQEPQKISSHRARERAR